MYITYSHAPVSNTQLPMLSGLSQKRPHPHLSSSDSEGEEEEEEVSEKKVSKTTGNYHSVKKLTYAHYIYKMYATASHMLP